MEFKLQIEVAQTLVLVVEVAVDILEEVPVEPTQHATLMELEVVLVEAIMAPLQITVLELRLEIPVTLIVLEYMAMEVELEVEAPMAE